MAPRREHYTRHASSTTFESSDSRIRVRPRAPLSRTPRFPRVMLIAPSAHAAKGESVRLATRRRPGEGRADGQSASAVKQRALDSPSGPSLTFRLAGKRQVLDPVGATLSEKELRTLEEQYILHKVAVVVGSTMLIVVSSQSGCFNP